MKDIIQFFGPIPLLITAGVIVITVVVVVLVLVSKGLLKIRVKDVNLEAPSRDNKPTGKRAHEMVDRTFLYREVNYLEDFIQGAKVRIGLFLGERNLEYSPKLVAMVCDKLHNRMLTWIILNHISTSDSYINSKTTEAFSAVISILNKNAPELLRDSIRYKALNEVVTILVKEFIPELVKIKESSGNPKDLVEIK